MNQAIEDALSLVIYGTIKDTDMLNDIIVNASKPVIEKLFKDAEIEASVKEVIYDYITGGYWLDDDRISELITEKILNALK